jgi:hypothetical protein
MEWKIILGAVLVVIGLASLVVLAGAWASSKPKYANDVMWEVLEFFIAVLCLAVGVFVFSFSESWHIRSNFVDERQLVCARRNSIFSSDELNRNLLSL